MKTLIEEKDREVEHERKIAALEAKDIEIAGMTVDEIYREIGTLRKAMTAAQIHEAGRIIAAIDEQIRRTSELLLAVDGSQPL